jgi:hypothetical protein
MMAEGFNVGKKQAINLGFLMSRGLGTVQRSLIAALEEHGRRFTVEELAKIAFPGELIERKHGVSVRRALNNLAGLDLHFSKAGESRARGWRYLVWRAG